MRRLLPLPTLDQVESDDLRATYAYPEDRLWVRANMVSSLDGVASADGRSAGISTPADRRVFRILRELADVILVGATTALAEGYRAVQPNETDVQRRAAAGQMATPPIAVVTRSIDFDLHSGLFSGPARTVVMTVESAGAERIAAARAAGDVVICGDDAVDIGAVCDAMRERGFLRVLCEGGPTLLAAVVEAGRLDELCLTTTPAVHGGDAGRIVHGDVLSPPARYGLASLLEEDGTLLQRWVT